MQSYLKFATAMVASAHALDLTTGSDKTGKETVDSNFNLSFAIGTPAQQANVVYHNDANRA